MTRVGVTLCFVQTAAVFLGVCAEGDDDVATSLKRPSVRGGSVTVTSELHSGQRSGRLLIGQSAAGSLHFCR